MVPREGAKLKFLHSMFIPEVGHNSYNEFDHKKLYVSRDKVLTAVIRMRAAIFTIARWSILREEGKTFALKIHSGGRP